MDRRDYILTYPHRHTGDGVHAPGSGAGIHRHAAQGPATGPTEQELHLVLDDPVLAAFLISLGGRSRQTRMMTIKNKDDHGDGHTERITIASGGDI